MKAGFSESGHNFYQFQGHIQDFHNGVSISMKLQEYIVIN